MKNNYIIIITGQVATGKTRFARILSEKLNIPLISKDDIKEILFDEIGYSDRKWSKKLGIACYKIMYQMVEQFILKTSIILESNFNSDISSIEISRLQKKYKFKIIQLFLYADPKILYQRFRKRINNGERHTGHIDHATLKSFQENSLSNGNKPLKIATKTVKINTDDFQKIDYQKLAKNIKSFISK